MTVNKSDLIDTLAKSYDVNKLVNDIFAEIISALQRGDDVSIRGFGTFGVKDVKGHEIVHPQRIRRLVEQSGRSAGISRVSVVVG